MTQLFQFLIILTVSFTIAFGWLAWKYRRDLIMGWVAYMAFKFFIYMQNRHQR